MIWRWRHHYQMRLSKIKINKLLMAHQDYPLLERAIETVEKLVSDSIQKIRK